MADVITNINGQPVTLVDVNGDGSLYQISLGTAQARRFIRDGELQELRDRRDRAVEERDQAIEQINKALAQRNSNVAARDALNAEITALNENISTLRDWLISQGDSA